MGSYFNAGVLHCIFSSLLTTTNSSKFFPSSLITSPLVFISVSSVYDAPVANNDYATTDEDNDVDIDFLSNDDNVDGSTLAPLLVSGPSNGIATLNGTIFKYSPGANFNGDDSFVYSISDGFNGTSTATGE